jgi:HTH-type transcriptional regulator / antitoxin HipB
MAHGKLRSPVDLGRAVRHARVTAGLTQVELADRLGVTQRWLSELETGRPKILDARLFSVIGRLGISVTWSTDTPSTNTPNTNTPSTDAGSTDAGSTDA